MKKELLILGLCIITSVAMAQSEIDLTFTEAVKMALEKNVALNTQKNNLFLNEARRLQGYANYLPSISASGNAYKNQGLQIDPVTGEGKNITADLVQGSINASYIVFNGMNRINFLKQNNAAFMAQSFLIKRTNQDVIFNVATQYLSVLLDQELLRIAKENRDANAVQLEQIKAFVDVGARAELDAYNQDAQVQNLQVLVLRAQLALDNDKALLSQTLQLDPAQDFKVVPPAWDVEVNYFMSLSLDSLFEVAKTNRPDLQQQDYLVDSYKFMTRANTSTYFPTISLGTSYGSTYFSSGSGSPSFHDQFVKQNPQFSYGVSVRIPIFDQFQTRTNRVLAKVTYNNSKLTRDNLMKSVKIDVSRSYKNFSNAVQAYRASQTQFEAGKLALETRKESFDLGVSSQVELAQANQVFVQGAASRAQAEVTLLFQKIMLEYALGTLKTDDLIN